LFEKCNKTLNGLTLTISKIGTIKKESTELEIKKLVWRQSYNIGNKIISHVVKTFMY